LGLSDDREFYQSSCGGALSRKLTRELTLNANAVRMFDLRA
jgi:hypothetical protein